jgi:hypothetical protein
VSDEQAPSPGEWRLTIDQITSPARTVSKAPDPKTKAEEAELARYAAETKSLEQDTSERKKYAARIYWLLCGWLVMLFALLFCRGFLKADLSDKVLIAIITGTTANILGIFAIVVAYLFPKTGLMSQAAHKSPPHPADKPVAPARKHAARS